MSKQLTITSCKQCPHLKQIRSPYTGDSFDAQDVDTICTHPQPKVKGFMRHEGQFESARGVAISVSDRPWQADKILKKIPEWCPL